MILRKGDNKQFLKYTKLKGFEVLSNSAADKNFRSNKNDDLYLMSRIPELFMQGSQLRNNSRGPDKGFIAFRCCCRRN